MKHDHIDSRWLVGICAQYAHIMYGLLFYQFTA